MVESNHVKDLRFGFNFTDGLSVIFFNLISKDSNMMRIASPLNSLWWDLYAKKHKMQMISVLISIFFFNEGLHIVV